MKLRRGHRRALYLAFALLVFSGAAAWWLGSWGEVAGEFGPEPSPWLHPALAWHGAAGFLWLLALGSLESHVRAGWRAGNSRFSGLLQIAANAILIVGGYGLYYASSDSLRELCRQSHLITGALLPLLLWLHVVLGKRRRRRLVAEARLGCSGPAPGWATAAATRSSLEEGLSRGDT